MNKVLQFILILILALGAFVGILVLVEPVDVTVKRTILINAAKDSVSEQVILFKNWSNWSPWHRKDTSMHVSFTGTDGQPGSSYQWTDDEFKLGEGEVKNLSGNDSELNYNLGLTKPVSIDANGTMTINKVAKGVIKVTWTLTKHTPYPLNALQLFVNVDKMIGGDFEAGLTNLKSFVEAHNPPPPLFEIVDMDYPGHLFQGFRETIPMTGILRYFNEKRPRMEKDLKDKINGKLTGIFYTWDTANKETDMAAVYPVTDTTLLLKEATFITIPPAKSIMAQQKGGYSKSVMIHTAISKYIADKHLKQDVVIEEYISGPPQEPDSNKWITNIYYLLK